MAEPITVAVRRGGVVESRHTVHAVAVRGGAVVAEAGDGGLLCFLRSAAKPIQALPVVRARPDLDDREIAIASASHLADPQQIGAVRSLLAKAPAREDELECGPEGEQAMLAVVARAAELGEQEIRTAVDGCGVIAFGLPLERMAYAFSRFEQLDAGKRVADAMRAYPALIRGPGAPDTVLMETLPGWIAKGGAEALLCAAAPDGTGVAIKVEDGSARAVGPAIAAFLDRLGHPLPALAEEPVANSRGEIVGEIRAE
jgi:L-asparaginase II